MRKTILILIALVCCVMMHAQDTVFNRVVTVERDYQPDIQQATKIKLQPVILKEEVEPNPVVYSTIPPTPVIPPVTNLYGAIKNFQVKA